MVLEERQMDRVILEDSEYKRALSAIEAAFDEIESDLRDQRFNRER
jgi:hypothetical protein